MFDAGGSSSPNIDDMVIHFNDMVTHFNDLCVSAVETAAPLKIKSPSKTNLSPRMNDDIHVGGTPHDCLPTILK